VPTSDQQAAQTCGGFFWDNFNFAVNELHLHALAGQ
jgi:hypothetical protein